jgi:hypothetical protein
MELFSLAGSLNYANRTALPGNAGAKTMNATSGRKCLEQFGRFNHVGLWAKTFSELLIGTEGWFSMRCKLTWKLKGTKYKRMYFQLAPSTHRTEETGFGLLPTVTARDEKNGGKMEDGRIQRKIQQGFTVELNDLATMGLLPTPNTMDTLPPKEGEAMKRIANGARKGRTAPSNLREYVNPKSWEAYGLLPTPMSQDGQNSTAPASQAGRDTLPGMVAATGTTSQLNPRFVLEMMGFPPDWTELPFLNGETKV